MCALLLFSVVLLFIAGRILWEELDWPSLVCAAHRIQNAIKTALDRKSLSHIFTRARHLVGHFKHSPLKMNQLEKKQEMLGAKVVKHVIQECPTRWNSAYKMLARLVELQTAIQLVLGDMSPADRKQLDLPPSNWTVAKELLGVLSFVDEVTRCLGGEKYSTASWCMPLLQALHRFCAAAQGDEEVLIVSTLKDRLGDQLEERFGLSSTEPDSIYALAAALDPRFRDLKCLPESCREGTKQAVVELAAASRKSGDTSCEPPSSKKKCSPSLLDELMGEEDDDSPDSLASEAASYFAEVPVKRSTDPLDWWRINSSRFPRLAPLARRYLCIPATSVPSERVFSFAGIVVDKRRCALSWEMIDALIYLHMNGALLKLTTIPAARGLPDMLFTPGPALENSDSDPPLPTLPEVQGE